MLKLTRRVGESVMIGDNVTITVISCNATQVSIGVDAPKDIPVHRLEIYNRIQREKKEMETHNNIEQIDHDFNNDYDSYVMNRLQTGQTL